MAWRFSFLVVCRRSAAVIKTAFSQFVKRDKPGGVSRPDKTGGQPSGPAFAGRTPRLRERTAGGLPAAGYNGYYRLVDGRMPGEKRSPHVTSQVSPGNERSVDGRFAGDNAKSSISRANARA
jgi:hypothetical protein